MADDPKLRELTMRPAIPQGAGDRRQDAVGQAIVQRWSRAGADIVWVGHAEPWKKIAGLEALRALPQVDARVRST